jgi:two-component system sensor histidine kinase YesM
MEKDRGKGWEEFSIRTIFRKLRNAKLQTKFTFIMFFCSFIPFLIFSILGIVLVSNWNISNVQKELQIDINRSISSMSTNIELCELTTKTLKFDKYLFSRIDLVKGDTNGDTLEIIDLYRTEIASIEKMINSNPFLEGIRIYLDDENMIEMLPVIYKINRAEKSKWYGQELSEQGSWYYEFSDGTNGSTVYQNQRGMVAYVSQMPLDEDLNAVLEIVISMDNLFPGIYKNKDSDSLTLFVDEASEVYGLEDTMFGAISYKDLSGLIDFSENKEQYIRSYMNDIPVVIGYVPIEELNGHLIKIKSLQDTKSYTNKIMKYYILGFVALFCIYILTAKKVVNKTLGNLSTVIHYVKRIKKGDMEAVIPDLGYNEVGELGKQFNLMMKQIKVLMEESIQREVLVKDSEFRALQNQIDAHFLYNVLESIKMMAEIQEMYEISDSVTALGNLLRYNLKRNVKSVALKDEIDHIQNYLKLINLRYDYQIYLSINIPSEAYQVPIPKMVLQPIIENSIVHGLEEVEQDVAIYVKVLISDAEAVIEISDMGNGMNDDTLQELRSRIRGEIQDHTHRGNGIGLRNIHERIQLFYGEQFGVMVDSKEGCYTKVTLRVPYHFIGGNELPKEEV